MEERPPDLTRHRQTSHAGRALAVPGGLILGVGVLAAIGFAVVGRDTGGGAGAPTDAGSTATAPPTPVLRIIFPEGFTRAQMADRITAVNKIAEDKRHVTPQLSATEYLRLTKTVDPPA